MLSELPSSEEFSKEVSIRQARDALVLLELVPDSSARAELRGLITGVRNHGGVIFFEFEDATGSLQLMARKEEFLDQDWLQLRAIKPSARVAVRGKIGKSRTGQPTIKIEFPFQRIDSPEPENEIRTVGDLDRVGVRLFLARLRYKAEAFFRNRGFLQIEPNFISTTWDIRGIEPLRVEYEGFGVPTYLTPSPSPQIIAAMEATGSDKVFAVGRCFTTTYRDETTSAESLIVMAKIARTNMDELSALAEDALAATLGDRETMPDNYPKLMDDGWHRGILQDPPHPGKLEVLIPSIQIYELPLDGPVLSGTTPGSINVLRACWPPRYVVAEGSVRRLIGQTGIGTITLFLERMVPLLKNVPLRQIMDLQKTGD